MITVILPWPNRKLSPNARIHWAASAKQKTYERYTAKMLTFAAGGGALPGGDLQLEITFCPPRRGRWDRDNALASLKAALDGVADALGIDDSRFDPVILRRGAYVKGGTVVVKIGGLELPQETP
jgi:crossover junction endodeoxyribonuclease RusA